MKVAQAALLAALLTAPAAAQVSTSDADQVDQPSADAPSALERVQARYEHLVDEALAALEAEARSTGMSRESFNRAAQALEARAAAGRDSLNEGNATSIALSAAIRQLQSQARSVHNDLFELHTIQMELIDQRLDAALKQLQEDALFRGIDRNTANRVAAQLQARAAAAKNFGSTARSIHNRLSVAVEGLVARAESGSAGLEAFQAVQLTIIRERLNDALFRLDEAARMRQPSRAHYERVVRAYQARAQAQAQQVQGF